jgi:two-component system response regulator
MNSRAEARSFEILLVEDNPADVYLFRQALIGADVDFVLTVIEDGLEALRFARREGKYVTGPVPHLAVLDLNLPQFGGIEILEALRNSIAFKHVPVIIMTSSADPREQTRAKELGIEHFITKPPDLEEFLQIGHVVKTLLLGHGARVHA